MAALTNPAHAAARRKVAKGDRIMFSSSEDNAMMKQIQGTHAPDGRDIDVKPLLRVIEDIFNLASPGPGLEVNTAPVKQAHVEALEESTFGSMLETIAFDVDRVSSEISCKCTSSGDAHATAMAVLNMLSYHTWDAKLAISLAAFAKSYGEFWLVAQSYTTNTLAKSVAILKQMPDLLEHSSDVTPRFDAVKSLIKVMMDTTKCIVEFRELPPQYITPDLPSLSTAIGYVPIAVYWTIRSIVACVSQITGLIGLRREYTASTTEAWELSSLAHKLSNMHSHIAAQLGICYKHIDEKKQVEAYQNLLHLFDMTHIDNIKVLKALIYAKDDLQPLSDGATKKKVNIDILRRKYVLLLISDLDISQDELLILEQIYSESRQNPTLQDNRYEVVWLPIIDPAIPWTEDRQKRFVYLQNSMPWYTVHHPSLIDRSVIKFIKEVWHFGKKPILVVLDPQGHVACPNALHMMWIWGSLAFPFTTSREQALWKEESWRPELLVDGIDPTILNWIAEGRYIFLYGGEDMEWIRKFTNTARAVAQAAGVPHGMVYLGRSNPKERVRRNISAIMSENLSHCWQDLTSIWFFWVRIESMWHSKIQLGRTVVDDPIMQEIMTILTYDGSQDGWAVLCRGTEMVRAKGGAFLDCLLDYSAWKDQVQPKGFLPAIRDHLKELHTPLHCNRLVLPGTAGVIPDRVACSECGRIMERFIMYQCCDE